ncbi:MAG: YkoF family thiamine/hydroxymethylpyrimidine-binding protein [Planctomycetota bacterium]
MEVEAEVSLYPLGEQHLSRAIESFVNVLEEHDCEAEVGPMSSLVHGESFNVFKALRVGYERACEDGGCVLIVKASNACPT